MNMPEFIEQTYQASIYPVDDILRFFDQSMAIYDIVKGYNVDDVCGNTGINHYSLQIQIGKFNRSELDNLTYHINNEMHNYTNMYGKTFQVNMMPIDQYANMSIQESH